ncbi:amidase [Lentzea flaviverrucosa]|uniref:Amidase n=1 Tax=Lentzea flaviverrucosa TaxID=200379 RepID=A0A1H9XXD6_9PSEU|nr:amidase [Lentzea flaviverrucosa]RDI17078.1 amidase [Lentzea flaviverrucosa]SES50850.1 amidase [Lentzea flaviverrucosa]
MSLHELTAAQQIEALRAKEISSRELTAHYLARVERHSGLGAFVTINENALDEAARADERLAGGDRAALLGLPLGIKDLAATAGIRTTLGSAALADRVPQEDSWTAGLLRRAGAVVLGKTNTSEFGATCYTENDVTPSPAVTPYAPTRYSSGSSGGAATAVAAGLLPVAHASDGAGSIRTPAATCHLVGMKPSRGLVSPAPATSFLLASTEGPIARTVEDAALLLDVMASPAPGDLYGWRNEGSFASALTLRRRLKVAMWTDSGTDEDTDPQAELAVRRTAEVLTALGHDVREIPLPWRWDRHMRRAVTHWFAYQVADVVRNTVAPPRIPLLRPYTRHLLATNETLNVQSVVAGQATLARYASAFLAAVDDYDVVLTPTSNGPPVPIGHYTGDEADLMLKWSCYTPWANLAGVPAISLPSHVDGDGLPHGVHLVGRARGDAELLALAAQLESAALWDELHPPSWHQ